MQCRLERHGVTLRDATQADLDELVRTMRPMDRFEHEVGGGGPIPLGKFVWAVSVFHDDAGLVGVNGSMAFTDRPLLFPARLWSFLTTVNADRVKLAYVKAAKDVVRAMWAREDAWVREAVFFPADDYVMSHKFYRKILGAAEVGTRIIVNGVTHTTLKIKKEDF